MNIWTLEFWPCGLMPRTFLSPQLRRCFPMTGWAQGVAVVSGRVCSRGHVPRSPLLSPRHGGALPEGSALQPQAPLRW